MTITPIAADIAAELAERERWHNESRARRVAAAQRLIQQASPPPELRLVNRLIEYRTLEGCRRWRKVPTWVTLPA